MAPDLPSRSLEAASGLYESPRSRADHGPRLDRHLGAPDRPGVQISLMTHDETAPVVPSVSVQVDDVDAAHAAAVRAGAEIVHPLTDEPWGVRRFFFRDPDGNTINVLSHH